MLAKRRNVLFALVGAAGLLLKGRYAGPFQELVRNYGGNLAASFAVYFIVLNLRFPPRYARPCAAGLALAVVELFEVTNGFGVMANVYDSVDLAANAVGVALALAVDAATSRMVSPPEGRIRA